MINAKKVTDPDDDESKFSDLMIKNNFTFVWAFESALSNLGLESKV